MDALNEPLELLIFEPRQKDFEENFKSENATAIAQTHILTIKHLNLINASSELIPKVNNHTVQIKIGTDTFLFLHLTINIAVRGIVYFQLYDALANFYNFVSSQACSSNFELRLAFSKIAIESQGGALDIVKPTDHCLNLEVTLPAYSNTQAISFPAPPKNVS